MITKVVIKDNENSPVKYIHNLDNFSNGKEYTFNPGVNIVVGPNGSGKSTLLKLIEKYLLIDRDKIKKSNISDLINIASGELYDGAEVYSDYITTAFRYCNENEMTQDQEWMSSFDSFMNTWNSRVSSTGQSMLINLEDLFNRMFSSKTNYTFPLEEIQEENEWCKKNGDTDNKFSKYLKYVKNHIVECTEDNYEYTVLIDEPDRNLDIKNIKEIYGILNERKEHTQIISVIHNPILIYKLSKIKDINFIEMEEGYIENVKKEIDELLKE
jgi:energy-coupling factor transporter ATP-binding protein EcfA2